MPQLPDVRRNIFVEETQFRGAVSEDLAQKLGSSINFINDRQYTEKDFQINGDYYLATLPYNAPDGFLFFGFNAEIVNIFAFVKTAGASGTTTLDLQYMAAPGGSWASVFSTQPSFTSAAGNDRWIDSGGIVTLGSGVTRPVLSTTSFTAGTALRVVLVSAQTSPANSTGLVVHYRPA